MLPSCLPLGSFGAVLVARSLLLSAVWGARITKRKNGWPSDSPQDVPLPPSISGPHSGRGGLPPSARERADGVKGAL